MVAIVIEDRASGELVEAADSLEELLRGSGLVGRAAELLVEEIKQEVRNTFRKQSGRLEESWRVKFVSSEGRRAEAAAVSDSPYAMIQNDGGVILPRRAKNLAIPTPNNPDPKRWPRDYPDGALQFMKNKRTGNALLLNARTKKPLFVLKNRVRIPATGYLNRAIDKSEDRIAELVESEVQFRIDREAG